MARSNLKVKQPTIKTHEGAIAAHINAELQLRRLTLATMLTVSDTESGCTLMDGRKRVLTSSANQRKLKLNRSAHD